MAFFSFGKKPDRTAKPEQSARKAKDSARGVTGDGTHGQQSAAARTPQEKPAARHGVDQGLISFGNLFSGDDGAKDNPAPSTPEAPPILQKSVPQKSTPPAAPPVEIPVNAVLPTPPAAIAEPAARPAKRNRPSADREMPQALEDCALSHANGQTSEALRVIEAAIAAGKLGPWAMQAWLIRFDLYVQLGLKAAYDVAAEQFAQQFERSAPAWPQFEVLPMGGGNSGLPSVNVSGRLSSASAGPLSALRKTIDRYDGVQLDFARFEDADVAGCQHLLAMLHQILRAKKIVRLSNVGRLTQVISEHAVTGDATRAQAPWLLKLELLQIVGEQAQFEEVAVDYAVTFGVSPPSWMDMPQRNAGAVADPVSEAGNDWFRVPSDIVQPAEEIFARIKAHAAQHDPLIIDLARVRRIDFISASQLVKLLAELRTGTQPVELRYANEMVSLLLVMMGAGEVAQLMSRR